MRISRNSEILFLYDAKMTNPNGDMDNENRPRMDNETDTNLVSDVRLKRYLRDYFETTLKEEIFVTEKAKKAEERAKQLKDSNLEHTDLIDVRLFGAVFATDGANTHITGPVQFNWGYSLNPVEINESSTITSSFSSGEGIGKDFRVKYSLIAFSGGINANTAKQSNLCKDDISIFDQAMVKAIPSCRTRSKIGQTPRLYIRVEAKNNKSILKDLRDFIVLNYKIENKYAVRDVSQFSVDISKLIKYLEDKPIERIIYWKDDELVIPLWDDFQRNFDLELLNL